MAEPAPRTPPGGNGTAPGPDTAAALRRDIDSGRTGDKVDYPDPAAAPLGSDDEAAGTPPTQAEVATARAHETTRDAPRSRPDRSGPWVWAIIIVCVAVILIAIAAVSWRS